MVFLMKKFPTSTAVCCWLNSENVRQFRSMIRRLQNINNNNHLFLFGARGTGKTTLLEQHFDRALENILWINLLTEKDEDTFGRAPDNLSKILAEKNYQRVIIDEVQKFPKLLDIVHLEIENIKNNSQFILIEIKSTNKVRIDDYRQLGKFAQDWDRPCLAQVWSEDSLEKRDGLVSCLPWQTGIRRAFNISPG